MSDTITPPIGREWDSEETWNMIGSKPRTVGQILYRTNRTAPGPGDYVVVAVGKPSYDDGTRIYPYTTRRLAPTAEQIEARRVHQAAIKITDPQGF